MQKNLMLLIKPLIKFKPTNVSTRIDLELLTILCTFWMSKLVTTVLMFLSLDWVHKIFTQSNGMKTNPIVTQLINQNTRI